MNKGIWWLFGISVVLLSGWYGLEWLAVFEKRLEPGEVRQDATATRTQPSNAYSSDGSDSRTQVIKVETVATGLDTPWSIVFTSDTRMLVAERPGRIRVMVDGRLVEKPLHTFAEVSETGEEGLMSLALHPQYAENRFLYASLAYSEAGEMWVKVVRLVDTGDRLENATILLDRIPAARYHAGSRLTFGPDGKLYIATGDATEKNLAQDMHSLAGKILRLNADGSIPDDNPFPGKAIWSSGHRNPQGLAWHPDTGVLYSTEHGPSVFDGPAGGDEVNLIEKGKNYGWPLVSHEKRRAGTEVPLITYTPSEAPASLLIYSGRANADWRGNLFFGALRGEGLVRLVVDPHDPKKILSSEKFPEVRFGRIREVSEGPDGSLYFTTSNRDGRGEPSQADDRIFRIHFEK